MSDGVIQTRQHAIFVLEQAVRFGKTNKPFTPDQSARYMHAAEVLFGVEAKASGEVVKTPPAHAGGSQGGSSGGSQDAATFDRAAEIRKIKDQQQEVLRGVAKAKTTRKKGTKKKAKGG